MKTIRQIADEIGVSKQAVHQKIKKEPLSTNLRSLMSTVDGVVYISIDGEKLIKQAFIKNNPSTIDSSLTSTVDDSLIPVDNEIISVLKENLNIFKSQLEEKDRQISSKDKHIDELNARLADTTAALVIAQQTATAAQALHAGTIQQKLTSSADEPAPSSVVASETAQSTKKSFWTLFSQKS